MSKHENKVLHFFCALKDCYRDEENRESQGLTKLDMTDEELTDDFYAMIKALFMFYIEITGDTGMDLLDFTYTINRLVAQNQTFTE